MSDLTRRVARLEGDTGECPACAPDALMPVIRWPGRPASPPPPEACPRCGRLIPPVVIKWPEGW